MRVYLHFEGTVAVEIAFDPEREETWEETIEDAWSHLVTAADVSEAAELAGHDIAEEGEPTAAYRV